MKEAENRIIQGLSEVLGAKATPHQDVIWGHGHRFFLHRIPAELELYSEKMVVRYHSPAVYLAMSGVKIERDAAGVKLTTEDGKSRTVLSLSRAESTASLPQAIPEAAAPRPPQETTKVAAASPDQPTDNDNPTERQEKPDRVTLTGNVGRDPEVRTTAKGRKVLKFPLGVHDGEKTDWHNILFFDERAEKAAQQLSKGQLVTIVGFKHEREAEVKKGNSTIKKKVVEIYGAAVQTRKNQTTGSSE